jgi:diguanylate cyclase (GGDEF)-like protein
MGETKLFKIITLITILFSHPINAYNSISENAIKDNIFILIDDFNKDYEIDKKVDKDIILKISKTVDNINLNRDFQLLFLDELNELISKTLYIAEYNLTEKLIKKYKTISFNNNKKSLEYYYFYQSSYLQTFESSEKAKELLKKAVKESLINNNERILLLSYFELGKYHAENSNFLNAFEYYNLARNYIKTPEDEIDYLIGKGNIYYYMGIYEVLTEIDLKALDLLNKWDVKEIDKLNTYQTVYGDLALSYAKRKMYKESLFYSEKKYEQAVKFDDIFYKITSLNYKNYVLILSDLDINEAKDNLIGITKMIKDNNIKELYLLYDYYLVEYIYYEKIKNYKLAHDKMLKFKKYVELNEPYSITRLYKYLSNSYYNVGEYKKSIEYKIKDIEFYKNSVIKKDSNMMIVYEEKINKNKLEKNKKKLLRANTKIDLMFKENTKTKKTIETKNTVNFIIFIFIISFVFILIYFYNRLDKITKTDSLTKLKNRLYINNEIEKLKKGNIEYNFILFDLDFFKKINDKFGHEIGDKVLIKIAEIITHHTREEDILSRIGGEEFLILIKGNEKLAQSIAERLRIEIEKNDYSEIKHKLNVSASFGLSNSIDCKKENMFDCADKNLYKSKTTGRNKITY